MTNSHSRKVLLIGWDAADFYRCNQHALEAAFLPANARDRLLAQLAEGYRSYL